jgi:hypothetical protein
MASLSTAVGRYEEVEGDRTAETRIRPGAKAFRL